MSLQDVLDKFIPEERNVADFNLQFYSLLESLYLNGGNEIQAMLDDIAADTTRIYQFQDMVNGAGAGVGPDSVTDDLTHAVGIDIDWAGNDFLHISNEGIAVAASAESILAHEIAHLYYGTATAINPDPNQDPSIDETFLFPDVNLGLQVEMANHYRAHNGEDLRLSYYSSGSRNSGKPFELTEGKDYTPIGAEDHDVVFVDNTHWVNFDLNLSEYSPSRNYLIILGDNSNDITGANGNDYIHTSGGNDTVFASNGRDYLDGGSELDVLSYDLLSAAVHISSDSTVDLLLRDSGVTSKAFIATKLSGEPEATDIFTNFEFLTLTQFDDSVSITVQEFDGIEVDGGSNSPSGDLLKFYSVEDEGVIVDLETGTASQGGASAKLLNFENVTGSDSNDIILGDEKGNVILGLGGNDKISGGMSSGAAGEPIDIVFGGSGNDILTLIGDRSGALWGGSGDDIITGNGNSKIWAGSGADIVYAQEGDQILGRLTSEDKLFIDDFDISGLDLGSSFVAQWVNGRYLLSTSNRSNEVNADYGIFVKINSDQSGYNGTLNSVSYQVSIIKDPFSSGISNSVRVINDADVYEGGPKDGEYNSDYRILEYSFSNITSDALTISDFRPGDFGLFSNSDAVKRFGFLDTQHYDLEVDRSRVLEWVEEEGYDPDDPEAQFLGEYVYNDRDFRTYQFNLINNTSAIINGRTVTHYNIDVGDVISDSDEYLAFESFFEESWEAQSDEISESATFFGGVDDELFDTLDGSSFVSANMGDDTVNALSGNDTLLGGAGSDSISAGAGDDKVYGDSAASIGGLDGLLGETVGADEDAMSSDTLLGGLGNDTIFGGEGADSIKGDGGDDALFGGDGDDVLEGGEGNDFVDGGYGNDVIALGAGSDTVSLEMQGGADTVSDFDVSADVLILGGQVFDTKAISNGFTATDSEFGLFIVHETAPDTSILLEGVTLEEFVTGEPLQPDGIITGTNADDTIGLGFEDYQGDVLEHYGHDTLIGGLGDDVLSGGRGNDTYLFGIGDGRDTITDAGHHAEKTDTVVFKGRDFDLSYFSPIIGHNQWDLLIDFGDGDSVQIKHQQNSYNRVEEFVFDDQMVTANEIDAMLLALQTTDGDDMIYGSSVTSDLMQGGTGNDYLSGGHQGDTYMFAIGDGQDTIADAGHHRDAADQAVFTGRNFDISYFSPIVGHNQWDLFIDFGNGDSVTIKHQQNSFNRVDEFVFDDQTVTADQLDAMLMASQMTSGDDSIYGSAFNDDIIRGGLGDDHLFGNQGADTYIFAVGDGQDTIQDGGHHRDADDTIVFEGRNFDASNFSVIAGHNQWDLLIDFGNGDSVQVRHQQNSYNQIESFAFDDRTLSWAELELLI